MNILHQLLHIDFETFSYIDLKKCGAWRYSIDPTTEILICCWALDDEEVETWVPCISRKDALANNFPESWYYGPEIPTSLAQAVRSGVKIVAHNAMFERAIWENIVVKRHKGPRTKRTQFICTSVRSAAAGLPRNLEHAGMALETGHRKDVEGGKLLMLFAKGRKPTKKDDRTRIMPLDAPHEFRRLCFYCQDDVRTERDIDDLVPVLSPVEQELFAFDMHVNERGLGLDIPLIQKTSNVVAKLEYGIVEKVKSMTKTPAYPDGLRPTQRDKMLAFFRSIGVQLENLQADHVRKYTKANRGTLTPLAKELLSLRIEAGKASTKKLLSMQLYASPKDGRARGTLLFYGAHTGRWSGKGVQPHNFIRGTLKYDEVERILKLLELEDPEVLELMYEWPISAISSCMRAFIIAHPGRILRVVDYASIEARVLAWLAEEMEALEIYKKGLDVYKVMAAKLYGVPYDAVTSEQRRIGKNLVLGCGYGLGAKKFVEYSEKAGTEISEQFAKEAVRAYRQAHKKIVQFWYDVERAAIAAVREGRTIKNYIRLRNLKFYIDGSKETNRYWLCIELPSGRCLRYYRPRVNVVDKFGEPAFALSYKVEFRGRLVSESTYGGKIVENIVQATARDIMVCGMLNAERAGYPVVGTVHDEVITEPLIEHGSVEQLEHIVCALPEWCAGCPVTAEGFESYRYRKG